MVVFQRLALAIYYRAQTAEAVANLGLAMDAGVVPVFGLVVVVESRAKIAAA